MNSPAKISHSAASRSEQKQQKHRRCKPTRLTATMTCQEAFRAIACRCLDDLTRNHGPTCEGDFEALHQMRIALTRLRTARSFFSPFIDRPEWMRLKGEFAWLNEHLSIARDLDVSLKQLRSAKNQHPRQLGQAWRRERDTSHRDLNKALQSKRYRTLVSATSAWLENVSELSSRQKPAADGEAPSLVMYFSYQFGRRYKKLLKASRNLADMNKGQRHRLRIRSKRLRYTLEFFEDLFPREHRRTWENILACLRKVQKHLGQLNDMERGRSIATALAKSGSGDLAKWRSSFPVGRKIRKPMIKAAQRAFQQLEELEPVDAPHPLHYQDRDPEFI